MQDLVVWVADVGSVAKGRFGWCRSDGDGYAPGTSIEEMVRGLEDDFASGLKVALGFECPLFIPVHADGQDLTKSRQGEINREGNRPWSAGAGSASLVVGLVESAWIFERIVKFAGPPVRITLDWDELIEGRANLFIWEAFVSGSSKGLTHEDDASIAAKGFWRAYPDISTATSVTAVNPFSMIGAAALRAGVTSDLALLKQPCVVIKASG